MNLTILEKINLIELVEGERQPLSVADNRLIKLTAGKVKPLSVKEEAFLSFYHSYHDALEDPLARDEFIRTECLPIDAPLEAETGQDDEDQPGEAGYNKQTKWFVKAEKVLIKLVANIMQTTAEESSKFANLVIAKASGVAGASGVLGLVGAFGTASTGAAISGLSGAAASNATLYWLGSLVGGGVFAGSVITGGIGLVAGFYFLKWWKGKPRNPEELTDEENAIIEASLGLIKICKEQVDLDTEVKKADADIFMTQAWGPFLDKVRDYQERDSDEGTGAVNNLNFKNLVGLSLRVSELESLSLELDGWYEA